MHLIYIFTRNHAFKRFSRSQKFTFPEQKINAVNSHFHFPCGCVQDCTKLHVHYFAHEIIAPNIAILSIVPPPEMCYTMVVYLCRKGGETMPDLNEILTKEEYTVYNAYCVRGCKLWEIVDNTGLTINQVLNRIKTARRKIIAAYNVKGVEK